MTSLFHFLNRSTKLNFRKKLTSFNKLLLFVFILQANLAQGHEQRPLYFELASISENTYIARLTAPSRATADNLPMIRYPSYCRTEQVGSISKVSCSKSIKGQELIIHYPKYNPSASSIIRFRPLSGESIHDVLEPQQKRWVIPEEPSKIRVAKKYILLGISHILDGWDHLLFILCLLSVAGSAKRLLLTITGFTIAHSITLAMTITGFIKVNISAIEAIIALSIAFIAAEVYRRNRNTLTWRFPILISSSIRLIHGFGFASVLSDVGLPTNHLLSALFYFNIGIEIGQIIFIIFSVTVYILIKLLTGLHLYTKEKLLPYGAGIVSSYWLWERLFS